MQKIGSRQLKASLGAVLRSVREQQAEYAVTYRGQVIARLIPPDRAVPQGMAFEQLWSEMDALAAEIARDWPAGLTATDALTEDRERR